SPCTATHVCAPNPSCVISPGSATTCVGSSQDFTVKIDSGTGPFTVVLSGCINETITGVTGSVTRSHACTAPGTCTLTANVTDANGCVSSPCTATHTCIPCNPRIVVHKQVVCEEAAGCGTFGPNLDTDNKSASGVKGATCPAFCYRITVENTGDVD